jgi:hypothetical protein
MSSYNKEYYQQNKERFRESYLRYYQTHKNEIYSYRKKYVNEHLVKTREVQREWYYNNLEKIKEYRKTYKYKPRTIFLQYQRSAKKRDFVFELTFEEFMSFCNEPCWYCGCKISTIGLDRVDNQIGYLVSNIISCCRYCNWMKRDTDYKVFISHCKLIANKHLNDV